MIRRISGEPFGSHIVARNPATAATLPGSSDLARGFPPIEWLLHGRSQVSQKLPSVFSVALSTLTVIPSRTVHHHRQPSSNVTHTCWLGLSSTTRSALNPQWRWMLVCVVMLNAIFDRSQIRSTQQIAGNKPPSAVKLPASLRCSPPSAACTDLHISDTLGEMGESLVHHNRVSNIELLPNGPKDIEGHVLCVKAASLILTHLDQPDRRCRFHGECN